MTQSATGNVVPRAAEGNASRALVLAYPEWPSGLGDPLLHARYDAIEASTGSAKGRKELVAAFRARTKATAAEATNSLVVMTATEPKPKPKLQLKDVERVKFPVVRSLSPASRLDGGERKDLKT